MMKHEKRRDTELTRREFLKLTAAGAAGIAASSVFSDGIGRVLAAEETEGRRATLWKKHKLWSPSTALTAHSC